MTIGMNLKRMRGRNHRGNGNGGMRHSANGIPLNRNHVFDSNGPDVRVRGTAQQLYEKYQQLGRDAASAGDRVMAEAYFQYAEHYFRILSMMIQAAQQQNNAHRRPPPAELAPPIDGTEPQPVIEEPENGPTEADIFSPSEP